jgi:C4-dicarboxylate-specific signal transduction histidine kinase
MDSAAAYTILTIDDEKAVRTSFRFFLEDYDFNVLEAENGQQGLDLFFEKKPDLVIVDIIMPRMDGIAVLQKIHEVCPGFPVIVISGTGEINDVVRALKNGAWDYILKPVEDMIVLLHAIRKALERFQLIEENRRYQKHLEEEISKRTLELEKRNQAIETMNETLIREIEAKQKAQDAINKLNDELELRIEKRTAQLEIANRELLKKERLAVLGRLTATVSHEIRNPLGVIRSSVYFLKQKFLECDEKTSKHLKRIDEQVEQCDTIIGDLMEYSRGRKSVLSPGNICRFVEETVAQFRKNNTEGDCISIEIPENEIEVLFDKFTLRLALNNILLNAVSAVKDKNYGGLDADSPCIKIKTEEADGKVTIAVSDNGTGMDGKTSECAFDPLFTTKTQGVSGLGLAISKKIINEHNGAIYFETEKNKGTSVYVDLWMKKK